MLLVHESLEDPEVRHEDLVHVTDGLEHVKVVLVVDSDSMWADSLARNADSGMDGSGSGMRASLVTGCCASQSMCRSGTSRAEPSAMPSSAGHGRGRSATTRTDARFGRRRAWVHVARRGGVGRDARDEVEQQPAHQDRIPRVRDVAAAFDGHEVAAQLVGEPDRPPVRTDVILVAVDVERRAGDRLAESEHRLADEWEHPELLALGGVDQCFRGRVESPPHAVFFAASSSAAR